MMMTTGWWHVLIVRIRRFCKESESERTHLAREIVRVVALSNDRPLSIQRQFLVAVLISKFPQVVSSCVLRSGPGTLMRFSQLSDYFVIHLIQSSKTDRTSRIRSSLNAFCIICDLASRGQNTPVQDAEASILRQSRSERRRREDDDDGGSSITAALETMRESIQRVIDVLSSKSFLIGMCWGVVCVWRGDDLCDVMINGGRELRLCGCCCNDVGTLNNLKKLSIFPHFEPFLFLRSRFSLEFHNSLQGNTMQKIDEINPKK